MNHPPPRAMPSYDYEWQQTAELDMDSFNPFDNARTPTPLPTDDEDEPIPETQQDQFVEEVAPKKKFPKWAEKSKWMHDEEVALAKAWVHISTCRIVGNEQARDKFWQRVLDHFSKELGGTTRSKDSINTKWVTMNSAISTFNGCYIQAAGVRNSGCDDLNVMTEALKDYKTRTGKEFTHIGAWNVVKDEAKWRETPQVGQSSSGHSDKRRKSSEGGNYESSSNNDDATVLPDLNEASTPSSRPRKGRKNVALASSSRGDAFAAFTDEYAEKKKQHMEEANMKKQALLDLQLEHQTNKTTRSDYKFFNAPHTHITDETMLQWVKGEKRRIAAKHGWKFDE